MKRPPLTEVDDITGTGLPHHAVLVLDFSDQGERGMIRREKRGRGRRRRRKRRTRRRNRNSVIDGLPPVAGDTAQEEKRDR